MPTKSTSVSAVGAASFAALGGSWRRALRAENLSPRTVVSYLEAHGRLGAFLGAQGMPQEPRHICREHIEAFLIDLRGQGHRPATVANRYRSLQQWFRWLLDEGEISVSPMARMRTPRVPEEHKPILTDEQVRALLQACAGSDFTARRDMALMMLLFDTGLRRFEASGALLEQLHLDEQCVVVHGKGARDRVVGYGVRTVRILDRYLRVRATHPYAHSPRLFIGQRGHVTESGVHQIVETRAAQAGVGHVSPHMFRHTYAHLFLEAGGQEADLMEQAGWRSRQMVWRYGSALRAKRAREQAKRLSPADRLE